MEDYHIIVEQMNDAVVIVDKKGIVKYINSYGLGALEEKKENVVGKYFLDFIDEESQEKVKMNYIRTMQGRKPFLYEVSFKKKNGKIIPVEIHAQKITYKGEDVDLAIIRDVSARKKAESVFDIQEKRFHAVTEHTPDIIARFDKEYRYVYINKAGEKAFGIPRKDFFWKTDSDLNIEGERTDSFKEAIDYVFREKEKKAFYSEATDGGERKYYYTILVPEFFEDGEVNSVLSITRDITEIREIDQVKTEFISITSHQLRSPLSVINWCVLSLIREDVGVIEEEQKDYLERIHDSTRKLIKITDVFLNTTMLDLEMFVFSSRKIDFTEEVKAIVKEFKEPIKEKDITLNEEYDLFGEIKFDIRVLKIIVRGIISNAIEYTSKEGNIDFSLKKINEEDILLKVGDDGCGVPKEDQEKIFAKFYRSEPARNMKAYGTGLDLYLIKEVLGKIGGSIILESPNLKYNKGSVFYIKLPLYFK